MFLLKQPGNGTSTYKLGVAGGSKGKSGAYYSVSAKSEFDHPDVRYDASVKKTYEAVLNTKHNPPYIDVVLSPERIKPKATK
jgi:hypothetical protein